MIVLTGGAGFIGSVILERLNRAGLHEVLVVDCLESSEKWRNLLGKRFSRYLEREEFLNDLKENAIPEGITAIIHMGAISSTTERDVQALMRNNFEYSRQLALFAQKNGARFIYASSAATYGNGEHGYLDDESSLLKLRPTNPYGFSKHLFDLWAYDHGILKHSVGLKFFNVYGPNEYHKGAQSSVAFKAFHELKESGTIKLFRSLNPEYQDGCQMRDFVYAKDCAELVFWLLKNNVAGLYNVGSGKARTWLSLAESLSSALGKPNRVEFIDLPEELKGHYQYFTEAPMEKLINAGYKTPFSSLENGVKDYVQNYLANTNRYL